MKTMGNQCAPIEVSTTAASKGTEQGHWQQGIAISISSHRFNYNFF